MTIRPSWAGTATHSAVSSSGAARAKVFCSENQLLNAPVQISAKKSAGERPRASRKPQNSSVAPRIAATGMSPASSPRRSM